MIIVTRDTVRNPDILDVRQLPRKFVDRVMVWPKGRVSPGVTLRLLAELQILRYGLWLLPLLVVGLTWRGLALPIAQAPIIMLILIWWVEMRLLRVPPKRRLKLMDAAAAERGLDLLAVQGREALTQIAAMRGQRDGSLRLVVEQSPLRAMPPLTFVSVQSETGPEVVDLTPEERAILDETLFRDPLTERLLHRINSAHDTFLREVTLHARDVSAHARLAAALR